MAHFPGVGHLNSYLARGEGIWTLILQKFKCPGGGMLKLRFDWYTRGIIDVSKFNRQASEYAGNKKFNWAWLLRVVPKPRFWTRGSNPFIFFGINSHKYVNYYHPGECGHEKECLRWHWLTLLSGSWCHHQSQINCGTSDSVDVVSLAAVLCLVKQRSSPQERCVTRHRTAARETTVDASCVIDQ